MYIYMLRPYPRGRFSVRHARRTLNKGKHTYKSTIIYYIPSVILKVTVYMYTLMISGHRTAAESRHIR